MYIHVIPDNDSVKLSELLCPPEYAKEKQIHRENLNIPRPTDIKGKPNNFLNHILHQIYQI